MIIAEKALIGRPAFKPICCAKWIGGGHHHRA
jgi:hypothetical protein